MGQKGCWRNYIEYINGQNCHPVESSQEMWFLYDGEFDLSFLHDGGPYHIETSQLICRANQSTGFYMTGTSVMKDREGYHDENNQIMFNLKADNQE